MADITLETPVRVSVPDLPVLSFNPPIILVVDSYVQLLILNSVHNNTETLSKEDHSLPPRKDRLQSRCRASWDLASPFTSVILQVGQHLGTTATRPFFRNRTGVPDLRPQNHTKQHVEQSKV